LPERIIPKHCLQIREWQVEFSEQCEDVLQHGGTPERQLLTRGQKFPQRLQAAGDEKILVGIGPAGEDVVGADRLARGEVDHHNAPVGIDAGTDFFR